MFGHLISKQAQVIGGGAMPSGALESTLIIARARVSLFGGMERWNGMVEWNGGMEQWNGMVE